MPFRVRAEGERHSLQERPYRGALSQGWGETAWHRLLAQRLWGQGQVQATALSFIGSVALGRLLNLSVLWFPHL